MKEQKCYCESNIAFENCCGLIISGVKIAETALALMKSRYSAYVVLDAAYLLKSTHVSVRSEYSQTEILKWAATNQWVRLEIIKATETTVEFKANYLDEKKQPQVHHEHSSFKKENGIWYYVDGTYPN